MLISFQRSTRISQSKQNIYRNARNPSQQAASQPPVWRRDQTCPMAPRAGSQPLADMGHPWETQFIPQGFLLPKLPRDLPPTPRKCRLQLAGAGRCSLNFPALLCTPVKCFHQAFASPFNSLSPWGRNKRFEWSKELIAAFLSHIWNNWQLILLAGIGYIC